MAEDAAGQRVSLGAIYVVFFQIGLMSFGGGLVSWIHREVVSLPMGPHLKEQEVEAVIRAVREFKH